MVNVENLIDRNPDAEIKGERLHFHVNQPSASVEPGYMWRTSLTLDQRLGPRYK